MSGLYIPKVIEGAEEIYVVSTDLHAEATGATYDGKTIYSVSPQTLTVDTVWTYGRELLFTPSGIITIPDGVTLDFNGVQPEIGNYQVFNCQGTGKVIGLNESRPEWFAPNNAADWHDAIIASITAGKKIKFSRSYDSTNMSWSNMVNGQWFVGENNAELNQISTSGIFVYSSNVTYDNVVMGIRFNRHAGNSDNSQLVHLRKKAGITIEKNYFYDNSSGDLVSLLYLDGCGDSAGSRRNVVKNNIFDGFFYGLYERVSTSVADNPYGGNLDVYENQFKNSRPRTTGVSVGILIGSNNAALGNTRSYRIAKNQLPNTLDDTGILIGNGVAGDIIITENLVDVIQAGIWVDGIEANGYQIGDVIISNNIVKSDNDVGIFGTGLYNFSITGNNVSDCGMEAIRVSGGKKGVIASNTMVNSGTKSYGSRMQALTVVDANATYPSRYITITGNTIDTTTDRGININGYSNYITILGNNITNTPGLPIFYIDTDSPDVFRFLYGAVQNNINPELLKNITAVANSHITLTLGYDSYDVLCYGSTEITIDKIGRAPIGKKIRVKLWKQAGSDAAVMWPSTIQWNGSPVQVIKSGKNVIINFESFYDYSTSKLVWKEISRNIAIDSTETSSLSQASGSINLDGVSSTEYAFNNGSSAAAYTPIFTSLPASGQMRKVTATFGGGAGVITLAWTNVTRWIGATGATTVNSTKRSTYEFTVKSSEVIGRIIAENY